MKLLKIIFLPALLFASYFFFTYAFSPSILTTGAAFKPTLQPTVAKVKDPFIVTTDPEYGNVFLCANDSEDISNRLKNAALVAQNENERTLFPSLKSGSFSVTDIQDNTYYYTFKITGNTNKEVSYNVFNCHKVEKIKTSISSADKSVVGFLGQIASKEEFNDVIWLLNSIDAFKIENSTQHIKSLELLDTGDDFMRSGNGIDTYVDVSKFRFYANMFNQAFTYSKVTGALTHEMVLDLVPSRSK